MEDQVVRSDLRGGPRPAWKKLAVTLPRVGQEAVFFLCSVVGIAQVGQLEAVRPLAAGSVGFVLA